MAFLALRFGLANILAFATHIKDGFSLDESFKESVVKRDSPDLLYLRVGLCYGLTILLVYLMLGNVLLCWFAGIDGS